MIYQLKILYGALLNGRVIYSTVTTFQDCTKPFDKINEIILKKPIVDKIKDDGFNPNDFEFGFITQEQYYNRIDSEETSRIIFEKKEKGIK